MWMACRGRGRCGRKAWVAAESYQGRSCGRLWCVSRVVASTSRRWDLMVGYWQSAHTRGYHKRLAQTQKKTLRRRLCPLLCWSGFWAAGVGPAGQSWGACCGRNGQAERLWCRAARGSGRRAQQTSSYELLGAVVGLAEGVVQAASWVYCLCGDCLIGAFASE